jgi:mannose-6-phosphate isomerase
MSMQWSPMEMTHHIRAYRFGERQIPEHLGKKGTPDGIVAETWEISDYRDTTATITRGSLRGMTLHEAVEAHPEEVVGRGWAGPHFPLLAKFLDASHMLPVHLHASDMVAKEKYHEPNGKTEAWHILRASPGATILAGVKPDLSENELIDAFKEQDYDTVMYRYPITTGDTVYVPGGVLHSFGPDTLIYEIQQTSDLGQNVMPNDLYGNPYSPEAWDNNIAHVLDELETGYLPKPNPGLSRKFGRSTRKVGAASRWFALERWTVADPITLPAGDYCWLVSNVGERPVTVRWGTVNNGMGLSRGSSVLIPAAIDGWSVAPYLGEGDVIVSYVPNLESEIIAPLRAAGYTDEQIASLGDVFIEE